MEEIENYLNILVTWLSTNNIGKDNNKRKSIARDMFWIIYETKLTYADLEYIIEFINDNEFTFKIGCLWFHICEYFVDVKYNKFFKGIFNLTPSGLDTSPNARCGKGELLYRLLRPLSRQPNKGDIIDDGKIVEIKGSEVRISSNNIDGRTYKKITTTIFEPFIEGNKILKGGLKNTYAYEIEKFQYKNHYNEEFKKLNIEHRTKLIHRLLQKLGIDNYNLCKKICKDGFNQQLYQRALLELWFNQYKKDFDYIILFGDGTNVKIVKDINCLKINKDYFRINHNKLIGWYVK